MPRSTYADVYAWLDAALRELVEREGSARALASELGVRHRSITRVLNREGGCNLRLAREIMRRGGWRITRRKER